MKNKLIEFLKGILIGIGNIAPGLSGGVIAVILNVYDRLINGVKDFFSHPFKVIKELWALIAGICLGILIGFIAIIRLIEIFPIPMMMLFIGFIIGPVPNLYMEVKDEKKTWVDYLVFFIIIGVIVGLSLINSEKGRADEVGIIALFIVGAIAASTMIIPGVSGTAILMIIGVFTYLVNELNLLIDYVLGFDIKNAFDVGVGLIPFGLGIVIGGVLLAKLVSRLFEKYQKTMKVAVIGLLVSCPFSIIFTMLNEYNEKMQQNLLINIIIGVITLVIGAFLSVYMAGMEKKNGEM